MVLWIPILQFVLVSKSLAYLCAPFAVLLPIDPSKNSPFLQHLTLSRSESTLQISKCGSRSVPPNLVRHASLVQIRIHKARSLARPLAKGFAAWAKSNLSWFILGPNKQMRQSYSESNSVYSNWCCVLIQCSQFHITRLFKFESLNPGVLPCRSLRLWIWVLMCWSPSSPNNHSKSPCIVILTSWFGLSLFLGSMLCWCRSVSTSMTNSPTPWLRQAPCLWNPQTRLCKTQTDPCQKHFLDVLHQSPLPIPQSHATALIPASSISSGELLSMGTGYATSLYTSPGSQSTPDLQANINRLHRQNPPRSFKIGSHWSEVSSTRPEISPAFFLWSSSLNCSRSTFRIVSINIGLHVFYNVVFFKFLSQISSARSSK